MTKIQVEKGIPVPEDGGLGRPRLNKYGFHELEFEVNKVNEETLGELFSYFILETILVGKLVGINPFNQPAVEQVKISTKKILS